MASIAPLQGSELIDCARANFKKGIQVAAERCGYGEDLQTFERELKKACDHIGVEIGSFQDLTPDGQREQEPGMVVSPDTVGQL
ncbi:hypothetical protein [Leptolyngbya sp. FACHB-261]|uniref:hypothetical protein n=1 Tax=Leptolyngbya sp. FACHB-261 TaxID=2692806 RepID=UPI0016866A3A|nr:hypothetical protein [Leptolyngbya sp. FACHB-261]MBD2104981.1 hypothetical protein [Leptolyngbya sp. FACHB-261]